MSNSVLEETETVNGCIFPKDANVAHSTNNVGSLKYKWQTNATFK